MLKVGSKRRRTKREIKEENQKQLEKENEYRTKMARLNMVEQELLAAQQEAEQNQQAAQLINDMIQAGVVQQQEDNTIVVNGD